MADTIDIKKIFNKKENEDARQEIIAEEVPEDEYLSAEEWIGVGDYIQNTQAELDTLKTKYVRGIRQNNKVYLPEEDNIVTLPGADTTVSLYSDLDESKPYVTVDEKVIFNLRAVSVQGGSATYETVNVEVYTAPIGGTDFTRRGNFSLRAKSPSSQAFDEVDFTTFLDNGKQQVQLIASGSRTGVSGTLLFTSITRTNLDIELNMAWQSPIIINFGQQSTQFDFHFTGSVERQFHLNIYGTKAYQTGGVSTILNQSDTFKVTLNVPATSYTSFNENYTYQYTDSTTFGVLNHGVHTIEAWLTCDNGYGKTLSSKIIRQQLMIINSSTLGMDLYHPYILLQNITREVTNYVAVNNFCQYAYWKPSTTDYTKASADTDIIDFLITDYGATSSTYNTEYSRQTTSVVSNTVYTLAETIEIETDAATTNGYFRIYNGTTDILEPINPYQIDLQMTNYVSIQVDNKERFIPTTGADFIINPKNRNNSEDNPARIINAAKGSAEAGYIVPSEFTNFSFIGNNDGWVTSSDDNQKVLRVLAGQKLVIDYDTFDKFSSSAASDLTIELDFKTRNITNEEEQIFGINETPTGSSNILGISLAPLDGYGASNSASVKISQDFHWMENTRTRITFNILQSITTKPGDSASKVALFRCFIDGVINREFIWKKELGEWYQNGSKIVIGQGHADIDIYSLRIYKKALNSSEILNDYISTLPSLDEKIAIREGNDIFGDDGLISRTLVENNIHGNTLTYHAARLPSYTNQGNSLGWVEIKRYDLDGNYLPRKSGTICKQSGKITFKGQGATAKTYYYWNTHYKVDDVTDLITIPLSQLDEETFGKPEVWQNEETGKYYITIPEWQGNVDGDWEVTYDGDTPYVTILDGWIDGDNNYRGQGYESGEGWFSKTTGKYEHDCVPLGKKLCDKINYASSMQNHKIGGVSAYNDLHEEIVGKNTLQQRFEGARVACLQDCYYRFMQTTDGGTPVFDGVDTYGAAKVDKPTWGYHKKTSPHFCVIEGADNSLPLTDFRVPFDEDVQQHVVLGSDEVDGWAYAGLVSWNYDTGDTYKEGGVKIPLPEIEQNIKTFCNFLYTHAPTIKVWVGTKAAFIEDSTKKGTTIEQSYKYWCTTGEDQYKLLRYNFVTTSWVDAGTWDMPTMTYTGGVCNLQTLYPTLFAKYSGQWDTLNDAIIAEIVNEAKTKIESNTFIKANSLKLHYAYVNQFEAGTDNNSKNTYFAYDDKWPTYVDDDGVQHYGIWELHVDDIDTLKKTDNSGRQLKPYYIMRNFDVDFVGIDPDTQKAIYNEANNYVGKGNVIFNLCNEMWEKTGENRAMVARMFNAMTSLVSKYNQKHGTNYSESPWGFEQLYYFRHTKYFCQSAYNETARIRYEYPAAIDFHSERGVYPMTQSLGDQLQTEQEYLKRRLVMFASYAQWGEFATEGSSATTGLSDVALRFGGQLDATITKPQRAEFKLSVVPHQFLVPCGRCGESNKYFGSIVAPGETAIFDITQGSQADDTAVSLCAANYFKSFGNLGDTPVRRGEQFGIQGARLTDVTAVGSSKPSFFNPIGVSVSSTPLIETIDLTGSELITGRLDLTNNTRLREVKLNDTAFTQVVLPKTPTLTKLELPETLTSLSIENLTNLDNTTGFSIQGVDKLVNITIVQSADIVAHQFYTRLAEALG